jgi:hypothetical protein
MNILLRGNLPAHDQGRCPYRMEKLNTAADGSSALELVATSCANQSCPTIFKSPSGNYVIQGYAVDAQQVGVTLSPGELLVEIPADLLESVRSS